MFFNDISLREKEREVFMVYNEVYVLYFSFLKYKGNIYWIKEGDLNIIYFYRFLKKRRMENQIYEIYIKAEVFVNKSEDIEMVFIEFYTEFLGIKLSRRSYVSSEIVR